jgi:hypothetical protein
MAQTNRLPLEVRPAVRDAILSYLYEKDTEMAHDILSGIIDEHCKLTGSRDRAFMYLNRVHQPALAPKRLLAPDLHPDLYERMNAYLLDRMRVEREEKLVVKNLLTAVMNASDSPEDWARLLPPALSLVVPKIMWDIRVSSILPIAHMTDEQIEAWQAKQERALNILKGRLALNLIF